MIAGCAPPRHGLSYELPPTHPTRDRRPRMMDPHSKSRGCRGNELTSNVQKTVMQASDALILKSFILYLRIIILNQPISNSPTTLSSLHHARINLQFPVSPALPPALPFPVLHTLSCQDVDHLSFSPPLSFSCKTF